MIVVRFISKVFLQGLLAFLPVFLTLYLLFWCINIIEEGFSAVLQTILPENIYFPGMGIILLFGMIFLIGLSLHEVHMQSIYGVLESRFRRLPLIRTIYGACKDFLNFFASHKRRKEFNQVVTVQMPNWEFKVMGFITEKDLSRHHSDLAEGDSWVAVYLPMGYQIGGYTLLMHRRNVTPVDMSLEDAMRFVLTAGVATNRDETNPPFRAVS
ncbi:MAG: DUF502 domain-containing protein [Puniceicoccales bacterium]